MKPKTKQYTEKPCPGCDKPVKRLAGAGGLVCGDCGKDPEVVERVRALLPTVEERDKEVVLGVYKSKDGREVEVTQVFAEDDDPVVEYRSGDMLFYKTPGDFLGAYRKVQAA